MFHASNLIIRDVLDNTIRKESVQGILGGLHIGLLIGATLIIESVFSIPGLGQLMLTAITTRDYPTVVAVTLVFAVFVMVINLLTDLLVALIDPRARDVMVGLR